MTQRHLAAVLALAGCCLLSLSHAQAQSRRNSRDTTYSGSGQSGMGNQGGFGGQSGGRVTGGFGGSQQSGPFSGSGMGGSPIGGGMGMGQGQMGAGQFGAGQQPGMMGQGANGQGGFVGGDAQDMRSSFENMNGRQRRRMMFDFMLENLNQMRDRRAERDARRREPDLIRVQLRAPTNLPLMDSQQVAVTLQSNLVRSLEVQGIPAQQAPQVELNGRTATVTGSVATDHEAAVIAKMVSLQPGVSQVENRLTVAPTATGAAPAASLETAPATAPSAQ